MPVRAAPAPYRRVVCRNAAPCPAGAVWAAVEPCKRRSASPSRRCLNSQSGPREGRRRAGKRHMTGFVPTSSVYPPVWQFDAPTTTSVPRWEPPTTPSYRRQKRERLGFSGLLNHFLSWLDHSHAHKPTMPPQAVDVNTVESTAQHQAAHGAASPASAGSVQAKIDLRDLRSAVCALEKVDEHHLRPLFTSCAHSLRQKLHTGELSASALDATIWDPLDSATRLKISTEELAGEMVSFFRSSLMSALEGLQGGESDQSVPSTIWLSLAQKVCCSQGRRHNIMLFSELMRIMPSSLRAQIPPDHIAELARAVVAEHESHHDLTHRWSTQARNFSLALAKLTATQRQYLDDDMRWFLLRQDRAVRERQTLSSWLIIRAYDAHATTADLLRTHVATAPVNTRLRSLNLWHVLVARFIATGAVESEHSNLLVEAEYRSLGQRWTFLVLALMATEKRDESLRELCSFLSSIGEFETMARALTDQELSLVRIDAVQAIAVACSNHNRALALYDALLSKGASEQMLAAWDWTMWAKYAKSIIKDPAMDSWRIWDVLRLRRRSSRYRARDGMPSEVEAKVQLLDQMSQWFLEATHINDRQLLRELERVIYTQRGLTGTLTRQALAHLTEVLTRDFSRGRSGRTERLEWLVRLVAQTQGMDRANRVASAIRGWRWTLARKRAAELAK